MKKALNYLMFICLLSCFVKTHAQIDGAGVIIKHFDTGGILYTNTECIAIQESSGILPIQFFIAIDNATTINESNFYVNIKVQNRFPSFVEEFHENLNLDDFNTQELSWFEFTSMVVFDNEISSAVELFEEGCLDEIKVYAFTKYIFYGENFCDNYDYQTIVNGLIIDFYINGLVQEENGCIHSHNFNFPQVTTNVPAICCEDYELPSQGGLLDMTYTNNEKLQEMNPIALEINSNIKKESHVFENIIFKEVLVYDIGGRLVYHRKNTFYANVLKNINSGVYYIKTINEIGEVQCTTVYNSF